jgi:hypothetical protein
MGLEPRCVSDNPPDRAAADGKVVVGALTLNEFLAAAKEVSNFARAHSALCAEYINQYWLDRDGRFANARVWLYDENDDDSRHIIISDMKNGYPPSGGSHEDGCAISQR